MITKHKTSYKHKTGGSIKYVVLADRHRQHSHHPHGHPAEAQRAGTRVGVVAYTCM